jgi:flavin reductase (DIM6/NTAB) family NADH-FMN oxidoreductase RutF
MRDGGLFLVSKGIDGKANAMTIGWGLVGTIWREPIFMVAVRLSRFTYKLLEESKSFTICLPSKKMAHSLEVCGIKSGRDMDKFQELKLTPVESHTIEAPFIEECPVHYECKIVYKNELRPGKLHNVLEKDVYPNGDYHVKNTT